MSKTIRVFPRKTNMTPIDEYAFIGMPTLFIPDHDEIHISVTFTWDIDKALFLKKQWENFTNKPVLIGGPAFSDKGSEFIVGKYLKNGVTTTSRGCPNNCSFCLVPKREGKIRELIIKEGNTIQDNNILACSDKHLSDVFEMLSNKKDISFSGGFEARRVTKNIVSELKKLHIKDMWVACDTPESYKTTSKAIELLKSEGFSQNKIRCYVIIGKDKDEENNRLKKLLLDGCLPFAQLYQPPTNSKKEYSKEWKKFQRFWTRPAIYKSKLKGLSHDLCR